MFLRQIQDIRLSNDAVSVSRKLGLTAADIEAQLCALPYSGAGLPKDPAVEKARLPPFAQVFYYLLFTQLALPRQDNFIAAYEEWAGTVAEQNITIRGQTFDRKAVQARLLRTYPSLIRDVHFYFLLKETGFFQELIYSLRMDYECGIDLRLRRRNNFYNVNVFLGTARGLHFKGQKASRHKTYSGTVVNISADFEDTKRVGQFRVLTEKHVEQVTTLIAAAENELLL